MGNVTVITPVAPEHVDNRLGNAIQSVKAQTAGEPLHLIEVDTERRGPGYLRNRMLAKVRTPFVVFLDADDWLEPDFIEKTLAAYKDGRHVYTGWWQVEEKVSPPEKAWCGGTWHLVTTLMPTKLAKKVGGFDETLPGMEDTDFYLKILTYGVCGIRLDEPLVHYRPGGGRGQRIHDSGEFKQLQALLSQRYGGVKMGCCDGGTVLSDAPIGERQPGDILAMAMWSGNRKEIGHATGRRYPRLSKPRTCWVDPRDVAAAPNLWQRLDDAPQIAQGVEGVANAMRDMGMLDRRQPQAVPVYQPQVSGKPDFDAIRALAKGAYSAQPVFLKSSKEYPSYCDFWRLVELSGYDTMLIENANLDDANATYIFVTPEGVPDCSEAKARCIFWQLEYEGDYTNQANKDTVRERWSSDPAHAKRTGYKYVLLGSHPGLAGNGEKSDGYDVIMLAYMVSRRETVKKRLRSVVMPPDYPGHCTVERHIQLLSSKMMLQVNQHTKAALAPLRFALAASYALPVIHETVPDPGVYEGLAIFADYNLLAPTVKLALQGTVPIDGSQLHEYLCVDNTFRKCVDEALG